MEKKLPAFLLSLLHQTINFGKTNNVNHKLNSTFKILLKYKFLIILFLLFSSNTNAQCSITSTTNASSLTCGTSPLVSCGGFLYIGNGTTPMSLIMNSNLDLTCLGAIQFIVRNNATLDFSGANNDLRLATGSSVIFLPGSAIYSGSGCSASDRIYIGGNVIANCNGAGSTPSFTTIVANGGINEAGILSGNQYICTYGTTTTTFSSTSSGGTWSTSNGSIATVNATSGVVTAVSAGTAIITYTRLGVTATRAIYVANGPSANAVLSGSTTQCQGTITVYSAAAVSGASSYSWSYSGTGATITPAANNLSASISFSASATSGNLKVTTTNRCGSSGGGNELYITINPSITGTPVIGAASNINCSYAQLNWTTVTNASGYYLDIATNSGFTAFVTGYNNFYVSGNNSSYGANNLPAGTLYYRVRGYNSCTTTANSGIASFTTTAPLGGSVSSPQSICSGSTPTSNVTLSGHSTTNVNIIRWERATDLAFTANFATISETTNVLSVAKMGVLTADTYFRAVVQNQFGSYCTSYSTPVLISLNGGSVGGSIAGGTTVCSGTNSTTLTLSGHTGTIVRWESSLNNFSTAGTTIANTTTTLTASNLSATTSYRAVVQSGTCATANSASGTVTVSPVSVGGSIAGSTAVCAGTNSTTLTLSGHTGTIVRWESSLNNFSSAGTTIANTTTTLTTSNLSATTSYRAVVQSGSCATANSVSATVTTSPVSVGGTVSGSTTVCAGTNSTTLTLSGHTGTIVRWESSLNNFSTAGTTIANTTTTLMASNLSATTSYRAVVQSGTCATTNSASGTVTVSSVTPPTIGTITNATCTAGGSVLLTGLPASGAWIIEMTPGAIMTSGSGTTTTISNLAIGNYTFKVSNSFSCTSSSSNNVAIAATSTTWNGTSWSNGTPTLASAVIINGNYDTATLPSFDACSVTVNSPFVISIVANKNITVQNELTVNTGATFNIQDDGSLVQTNNSATNTGTITFLRTTDLKLKDYVYWSSPVENFSVRNISINTPTSLFWKWNPSVANPNGGQGNWQNANETMVAGKGYIVRAPTGYSATVATPFTATFTGKPHNGVYTPTLERGSFTGTNYLGTNGTIITKTSDNWNLIGNPYPSAINAVDFLTANTNIDGTIRIWTHASAPSSTANPNYNSFTYNYSPTDYIVFNGTAATGGPHAFDGKIAAGQSFMVIMNDGAASTQTVTFNNAMRNKSYDNSQFYKSATALKTDSVSNPSRIWLDLISPTNEITRTVVGYVQGATQEKDRLFDARNNSEVGQNFYSLLDGEKMIIQGKALPLAINDIVPMGMNLATTGEHIIAVASVDGVFENGNQTIYLLDKLNNVTHNLTNAPYKFEGNKGTDDNRFELRYVDTTLSTTDFDLIRNNIWVFGSNNGVEINSRLETIKSYQVYDVLGRVLETKNNVNANTLVTSSIVKNNQALIVKITLENGLIVTKKMVY